jgi:predicted DNA-binding ribbon-helix-helix protein
MAQDALRLDQERWVALERVARRRHVPVRNVLREAVDEYPERVEDEELLESSAHQGTMHGMEPNRRKSWESNQRM